MQLHDLLCAIPEPGGGSSSWHSLQSADEMGWQVLQRKLGTLLERLDTMGLSHLTASVLSSVPATGVLQDQVWKLSCLRMLYS